MSSSAFSSGLSGADDIVQWQPGLHPVCHSEIFASARDAGGTAAALALALDGACRVECGANDRRAILWVQDKKALRLGGRPYRHGLPEKLRARMIHVSASTPEDALFALEEGLRCRDLICVIGEIVGNPRALSFVASRRLTLTAEKHGVPLYLVRLDARHDLSSARMRWDIRSHLSQVSRWDHRAPGLPCWRAELFRARVHPQGEWILYDGGNGLVARNPSAPFTPDHGHLADKAGNRSLAAL
ncbi:hypothetical protein MB02_04665 [Croceicoccus estronivorus]|uniref:hypothetical protein n=1 Tax=Croceicoccus estronivorus TaxID=1172626 RepID=UPI0008324FCF|nr:hypothetical protein [Croceicoccus estronivorus]OCC24769.1 hypothetical protein MB02_04665 [Croceicoccus estronivorus]